MIAISRLVGFGDLAPRLQILISTPTRRVNFGRYTMFIAARQITTNLTV